MPLPLFSNRLDFLFLYLSVSRNLAIENDNASLYSSSANGPEVVFYTLSGGGHTWPGGGKMPAFIVGQTPSDINATRLMWDFFQRHPLRR